MSANDIGHGWLSNLSNATMVNVLLETSDIRNLFNRCQILHDDDINSIVTDITVFLNIVLLPFNVQKLRFYYY